MNEVLIVVISKKYWAFVILALLVYVPITSARWRPWVAAALNLSFLRLYLTTPQWLGVMGAVVTTFVITQCIVRTRFRMVACLGVAIPATGLFLLHKFPALEFLDPDRVVLNVLAMLGFSYVALRTVDMLRNVYESRCRPPSLPQTVNYLLPFHMLAAGPIQAYPDFVQQPVLTAALTRQETLRATERIAFGMFKKYVLAVMLQRIFLTGFTIPGWYMIWEAQIFYIWLYLDFSALSDIAIGIGTLLGILTPENFNRPYLARNLIDFWERWHISLSQFIRRNIFIPLQLRMMRWTAGRHPLVCASVAFSVAFVLCGLWHQGTIRYFLWGALHALGLMTTNLYRDRLTKYLGSKGMKAYLANPWIRAVAMLITFEFVAFSLAFIQVPLSVILP